MEEKKKGFSCSYALLVVILCGALAVVTDYAIIQSKTQRCGGGSGSTTEKVYSYEEVAGRYVYSMDIPGDIYYVDSAKYELVLNPDGTCIYKHTVIDTSLHLGNYIISGDKIYLNLYLTGGGARELQYSDFVSIIDINEDNSLTDYNPFWGENFEISSIKLNRDYSYEMVDDFSSIIQNNL